MKRDRPFSEKLLESAPESRRAYFDGVTIAHPLLVDVDRVLQRSLRHARGGLIVMLFGPAGVGKTTLLTRIEQWLVESAMPAMRADPGRVASLRVEAVTEGRPTFGWGDYYRRALIALDEPLIDSKFDPKSRDFVAGDRVRRVFRRNATIGDLRYALEQALLHRRPLACLVDEAHHFAKISTGRRFVDQMDCIKSLANLANVPHILAGSYGLLDLMNLNGQLSRRTVLVHFRRYRGDSPKDVQSFRSAVWTLQRHLPVADEPDLVANWEFLMVHSAGCIGILKDWLRRALDLVLQDGGRFEAVHLEETVLAESQLRSIASEAWDGEQRLAQRAEVQSELRTLTGFKPAAASANRPEGSTPKRPAKRSPGRRSPTRDKVGA